MFVASLNPCSSRNKRRECETGAQSRCSFVPGSSNPAVAHAHRHGPGGAQHELAAGVSFAEAVEAGPAVVPRGEGEREEVDAARLAAGLALELAVQPRRRARGGEHQSDGAAFVGKRLVWCRVFILHSCVGRLPSAETAWCCARPTCMVSRKACHLV